jgi:hypothetical protein
MSVGADEEVAGKQLPVPEPDANLVPVLLDLDDLAAGADRVGLHAGREGCVERPAMQDVSRASGPLEDPREAHLRELRAPARADDEAAEGSSAREELVADAERLERTHGGRQDPEPRAHLAELRRPLEQQVGQPELRESRRGGHAADPAADDQRAIGPHERSPDRQRPDA